MKDQAVKLRAIVNRLNSNDDNNRNEEFVLSEENKPNRKNARVITVTSGKGGVGKTNITINLAIKMAQLGLRVVIIDADLGLSNVDIVFGMIPKYNLSDVINHKKSINEILENGPNGVKFISGGSGLQELIKINREQLGHLLIELGKLDEEADIIFIDTGAGINDQVLSFVYAAKEVIVVTTPEPTAITDAYALIKVIAQKDSSKKINLILNKANNLVEANNALDKLYQVCLKFLGISINRLGYVCNDANISKAVMMQQPFVIAFDKSAAAQDISSIAKSIARIENNKTESDYGIRLFVNRLKWLFRYKESD
ncbi:MinD/ParA family protein [Lutispora thermophila]|uniref:Flagellar biosynthesis protein FlhG n=1 Tax=Lutispora thermophila DSM 19022 TaxID=1122184 RepID=A0A1M6G814_9FIRM|nr:MinD/ParA family protein [Lutispora thermophila]SHJ06076.1 flagellar biosynthesis protein FlhG [Lutispora thermophila DSM 19022]